MSLRLTRTDDQRSEPEHVQAAALMLIATLVERCCLWSDLRRRATASGGEAPRLVTALLARFEARSPMRRDNLVMHSGALLRCLSFLSLFLALLLFG